MATTTTPPPKKSHLWTTRPERTEEEKSMFRSKKIAELRTALAVDIAELEQKLSIGGEFRDGEILDDAYLLRWLRARYWNVHKAAQSIRAHAAWRFNYCPKQGRIQPVSLPTPPSQCIVMTRQVAIANELQREKICLQGVDNHGRGFAIIRAAKHNAYHRDADEVERLICYSIDRMLDIADIQRNPERRVSALFDLTGITMSAIDLTAMYQVNTMLSQHFVERLGKLFVFNAPLIFWATWKTFTAVLAPESLEKIEFIYPKDLTSLHKHIPIEPLPKAFGGRGEYSSIHEDMSQR